MGNRRIRVANNIRVRRAGLALSKATSLNEVFESLRQMFEFEEFSYANVQLGQPGRAQPAERAFSAMERRITQHQVQMQNGRISWSWKRDGVDEDDVIASTDYWCFRLPLATASGEWGWMNVYRPLDGPPLQLDLDYLSGFLRRALSEAAERVISSFEEPTSSSKIQLAVSAGKIAG